MTGVTVPLCHWGIFSCQLSWRFLPRPRIAVWYRERFPAIKLSRFYSKTFMMNEIQKFTVTEPYIKSDCGLGEAPFWERKTNTLRFVDIVKSKLHEVDLNIGPSSHKILADLDISIGTTADISGSEGGFAFGGKHGYGIFDRSSATYKYIKKFWTEDEIAEGKEKRMRANDGAVDSRGRYWVGTMNDPLVKEPTDEGILFRLDPDLTLHRMVEKVTIPNGMSWSQDDKTMYMTDSPTKNIFAYDFDAETGQISNKRVFFHVDEEEGVPDGHAQDAEGCLWVSIFGCGKVVRVTPQGKIVAEISLPTRCCSCPGFAGEDLYITTAEEEDAESYPESAKLQGSVFKCHVGVKGSELHRFKFRGN